MERLPAPLVPTAAATAAEGLRLPRATDVGPGNTGTSLTANGRAPAKSRHPRWGIAALLAGSAAGLAAVVIAVLTVVVGSIKSSDVYRAAMDRVRRSPAVASALGAPLAEGAFITGNIHVSGPTGLAELEIPVSGPRGRGRVYVDATKQAGAWHFDHLVVQVDPGGRRLDLLPAPPGK